MHSMMRPLVVAGFFLALSADREAWAGDTLQPMDGWQIEKTVYTYGDLVARTQAAVEASPLNVVTKASATVGAKSLGETIPGNMVLGVYGPQFAVRMLDASVQAGIEAPIRLYVTENEDGTATLSYVEPSHVFAPYADGGEALKTMAAELDQIFAAIVAEASGD